MHQRVVRVLTGFGPEIIKGKLSITRVAQGVGDEAVGAASYSQIALSGQDIQFRVNDQTALVELFPLFTLKEWDI